MSDKFLKVDEVAVLLRCTPWTVYQLIRKGTIPSIRVGRVRRVKQSSLEEWIRAQEDASSNGRYS